MERRLGRGLGSLLGDSSTSPTTPTSDPQAPNPRTAGSETSAPSPEAASEKTLSEEAPHKEASSAGTSSARSPVSGMSAAAEAAAGIGDAARRDGSQELRLDAIRPNPRQPRTVFDPGPLEELRDSIRNHGVLQPVVVRRTAQGFELIAGERRWRGARLAGLERIPAIVREDVSDDEMLELALVENVQRRDLDALEKARGYRQMMEALSLTQDQVAAKVGLKRSTVANHLRLLELPERAQDAVREGLVSMGHARALLGLSEEKRLLAVLAKVAREGLSVRQTESLVREAAREAAQGGVGGGAAGAEPTKTVTPQAPWVVELQDRMRDHLGTKVELKNRKGYRGQITIDYYGREDLERLLAILAPRESL